MYNQQQRPKINKVQIVGMALTVAVVGGVGIRIHSFVENHSDKNPSAPDQSTMMKSLPTEQLPQTELELVIIISENWFIPFICRIILSRSHPISSY